MTNLTPSDLVANLQWRYATKSFTSRQIPAADWDALQEALRLTPTSFGLQPYKFLVIEDPTLRAQLRGHSWNQAQVTDASRFVVFLASNSFSAADVDHLIQATATARGTTTESLVGYRDMMVKSLIESIDDQARYVWAIKQTYIALGNLMTAAAAMGIDACPIEGIDAGKYDEILKVEGYKTQMVLALGYRSQDDKYASLPKVRYCREELFEVR
jgi:nitroreductase